jgi:hypothetical protein
MPLTILDATTRAAVAAATDQESALTALLGAADVTVQFRGPGDAVRCTQTYGAPVILPTNPRTANLGPLLAHTPGVDVEPTLIALRAGGVDTVTLTCGVGTGDVPFAAAWVAGARPNLSDGAAGKMTVTADLSLPLTAIPTWRQGLTPLTWYAVGGNTLHSIRPTNDPAVNPNYPSTAPWAQLGPQSDIISAWGGGAWDEANQRLWVAGGGHSAYLGNEPYTIDLDADSPVWVMRGYPTGSIQRPVAAVAARKVGDTDVGQDGRPLSVHTYGLLTVLGNGRLFLGWGAFAYDASGTAVAEFDPTVDDWDMSTGRYAVAPGQADVTGSVEYDPGRNRVWQASGSRITSYDCSTKVVTKNYQSYSGGVTNGPSIRRMPEHDLLAVFSGNANTFGTGKHVALVNPASPGVAPVGINATTQDWGYRGVTYDTLRKRFMAWHGGGAVATLTPPASSPATNPWTYGSLTTSTAVATPSAAQTQGTYGRAVYSAKYDCLVVINGTTEQLYVLPLS